MGDRRPGDNLYTSSTVAIEVTSGRLKGYHQYHPNDSWDWDEVSPPLLIDYKRQNRTVKGLVNPARNGYLWFLERTDGPIKFVGAQPFVQQNVFNSIDPKTGRPEVDPEAKTANRRDGDVLSFGMGRQELAAGGIQSKDADDLHSGQREPVLKTDGAREVRGSR